MDFNEFLSHITSAPPKMLTSAGKPISHFTMLCYFKPGGRKEKFTFRGDDLLVKYQVSKINARNQLEALILKYNTIKESVVSCKIYNNRNPQLEQLIFDQMSDGRVNINKVKEELIKLEPRK